MTIPCDPVRRNHAGFFILQELPISRHVKLLSQADFNVRYATMWKFRYGNH